MLDTEKTAELTNFNGTKYYTVLFYIQSLKKNLSPFLGIVESKQWEAHRVEIILGFALEMEINILVFSPQPCNRRRNESA